MDSTGVVHIPNLFKPSPSSIPVIDPQLKHLGRVAIPNQLVSPTAAIERWRRRDPHPPSLCMLFQLGRCHAGADCNQVHADPVYVDSIRRTLGALPHSTCCFGHGDVPSYRADFRKMLEERGVQLNLTGQPPILIPADRLAMTLYWDRILKSRRGPRTPDDSGRPVRFNPQRVCKLHQREACKYGVDCNSVHLCRELWAALQPLVGPALLPDASQSSTATSSSRPPRYRDPVPPGVPPPSYTHRPYTPQANPRNVPLEQRSASAALDRSNPLIENTPFFPPFALPTPARSVPDASFMYAAQSASSTVLLPQPAVFDSSVVYASPGPAPLPLPLLGGPVTGPQGTTPVTLGSHRRPPPRGPPAFPGVYQGLISPHADASSLAGAPPHLIPTNWTASAAMVDAAQFAAHDGNHPPLLPIPHHSLEVRVGPPLPVRQSLGQATRPIPNSIDPRPSFAGLPSY